MELYHVFFPLYILKKFASIWIKISMLLAWVVILGSCSSSSAVLSSKLFQKRKHMKGFYFAGFQHSNKTAHADPNLLRNEKPTKRKKVSEIELTIAKQFQESHADKVDAPELKEQPMQPTDSINMEVVNALKSENQTSKKKRYPLRQDDDEEDSQGAQQAKAAISFFASIIGWLLLISSIILLILNPFNIIISLILLGISLVLEAFAYYFGGDTEDTIKAGSAGYKISVYYWWFMGIILSLFLSIGFAIII